MIILNAAQCNYCKDIIESRAVHDYVECSCGKIAVDGGKEYFKRTGEFNNITEYSICIPMEEIAHNPELSHFLIRECIRWGKNYDKDMNRLPETIFIPIKDLDTDHIEAIIKTQQQVRGVLLETLLTELEWRR